MGVWFKYGGYGDFDIINWIRNNNYRNSRGINDKKR